MFDKKTYVKEKILTRLNTSKLYQGTSQKKEISDLIDSLPNLDMVAYNAATFEESTIGWLSFCKTIDSLLENGQEINKENLVIALGNKVAPAKTEFKRSSNVEYDYSKIDEDPFEKLHRLSQIAEENDLIEDIEYDFLTDEGLKIIGAVDRNDTSLDAVEVKVDTDKLMPIVRVKEADLVNNAIVSPFTGTTQVAQVTSDVWMDIDTEQLFRVKVSKEGTQGSIYISG